MKTTTEPESKESKGQEPRSTEQGSRPSDGYPDPDFPIEGTGGPIDGGGDPYTGPPKKQ